MARSFDAFVSYAPADQKVAQVLVEQLERRRLRCFIAPRDVQAGKNPGEAIADGIDAVQTAERDATCEIFVERFELVADELNCP